MDIAQIEGIKLFFEQSAQRGESGQCRLRPCVEIKVYYDGLFKNNTEGILHFYTTVLPYIKDSVTFYDLDGKMKLKKIKKDVFDMLPFWTTEVDEDRLLYGLILESGKWKTDLSDKAFHFYQIGTVWPGYLRLVQPLNTITDSSDAFLELAAEACRKIQLKAGYGGYGVSMWGYYGGDPEGAVYAISNRYHGIDLADPDKFKKYQAYGITSVNWLTLLGHDYIDKLGGKKRLGQALGSDVRVHDLEHGIMIQAGPEPGFGDVNRKEFLPLYHHVGRILKPVRLPESALGVYDAIGGTENTRAWLARFDD